MPLFGFKKTTINCCLNLIVNVKLLITYYNDNSVFRSNYVAI